MKNRDYPEIPKGIYCYSYGDVGEGIRRCPYWSIREDKPEQDNGYCSLLDTGDWEYSFGLLWDSCKLCGINEEYEGKC